MTTQPFITTAGEMIDQYWQEHDGDHFYKDELKDVVKEICRLQKERLIKEVESVQKEYSGKGDEVGWGACEIILQKLK